MNKFLITLLTSLLLLLSACSTSNDAEENTEASVTEETNEDTSDTTEDSNETSDLEKENEKLKQQLAEKENEELKKKLEESDGDNESQMISDKSRTDNENKTNENTPTVESPEECVLNLFEDCLNDYTEDELMEAYYDLGQQGEVFYAGATSHMSLDHVIEIVRYYDEHGKSPYDTDEERYFDEYYTGGFPVTLTEADDFFTYDTLTNFIFQTYLNSLSDYYNDMSDDVLYILDGAALSDIQNNKASGNFQDYQNSGGSIVSIQQTSENEYTVTVNRSYSHATSDGEQTSQVTYTIIDTEGMLKVIAF